MTYDQLFKAIKAGRIAPAYVFFGQEAYVRESALQALRAQLLPEGFEQLNESLFEGVVPVVQLTDSAETLPMMCDRRLIVVRNWTLLSGRAEGEEAEAFIRWMERMPDTCCLVFVLDEQPDARKKLTRALRERAEWVEFSPLSDADIVKWANRQLKGAKKQIEPDAAEQLVFMAGRALTNLSQELDKLCAYALDREVITRADVEAVVTPSTECTVFQMIDCLLRRQSAQALRLLKAMLENGESRVGTMAMLTRQMRMLTHIRLLRAQGMTLPEIERKLALNHYAAMRAAEQAGRFSAEALEAGYKACVQADYAVKSGRVRDVAALDALMLRLAEMK